MEALRSQPGSGVLQVRGHIHCTVDFLPRHLPLHLVPNLQSRGSNRRQWKRLLLADATPDAGSIFVSKIFSEMFPAPLISNKKSRNIMPLVG